MAKNKNPEDRKDQVNSNQNKSNNNRNKKRDSKVNNTAFLIVLALIVVSVIVMLATGVISFKQLLKLLDIPVSGVITDTDSPQTTRKNEEVVITDKSYLKVYFIDVGQADSILIEEVNETEKSFMLIDAGTSSGHSASVVTDFLKSHGVTKLKYFILTHPHSDHIGAAKKVIDGFAIDTVFIPDCKYDTSTWNGVLTALANHEEINTEIVDGEYIGKAFKMLNSYFTILWPDNPIKVSSSDINNVSIVCRFVYGNNTFMFTGDAEKASEKGILDKFSSSELKCDVLKAGHHGSDTASTQAFLNAVKPTYVVISCGTGNSYGHPHAEPMERYKEMNCEILRTDLLQTIVMVSDGTNINVLKDQ